MKLYIVTILLFQTAFLYAQSDDCSAAPVLNSSTSCSATAGSTAIGFTNSVTGCATGNEDDDAWYKFTAIAATQAVTVDGAAGFDAVVACYTSCAATASPTGGGCRDQTADDGVETLSLSGLTVGTTYYIKLHDYGTGGGAFSICVTGTPAPANDECAGATTITPGIPVSGTTAGADQDYTWLNQPCTNTGEVWYKFTTPASVGCYSFAYDQIINGCNAVSIWESACPTGAYTDYQANFSTNNYNDQGSNESELAGMLPNTTYYISVSNDLDASFTLNVRPNTPLASNDQCTNSAAVGTNPQAADNAVAGCEYSFVSSQDGGLQASDPANCDRSQDFPCSSATGYGPAALCALTLENISWYQFSAASTGTVTITFSNIECNNGGGGFQSGLFTGSSCSSLTATGACIAASSGTATYTINATEGASYYIAMDGNAGSNCHYLVSGLNIVPLPVELGEFRANVIENKSVKLTWNTYSELNNDYFTVERSRNGYVFEKVAVINAAGNSLTEQIYQLTDESPFDGTSYYRLSQTDYDGNTTESSFAEVSINREEELSVKIFPNPSSASTTAYLNLYNRKRGPVKLEIYEAGGKLLDTEVIHTEAFETKMELRHPFSPGIYFVIASNSAGETAIFKWIID